MGSATHGDKERREMERNKDGEEDKQGRSHGSIITSQLL